MATVAVLGCGPAGLFCAQALALHNLDPVIISRKQKSVIYGAQYLHKPIPGLSSQRSAGVIKTMRIGQEEVYAQRVYGNAQHVTSWKKVRARVEAWDLRGTYDVAWEKFQPNIVDLMLGPDDIAEYTSSFDLVISTIPLWSICQNPKEHRFNSVDILVKKEVSFVELGIPEQVDNWVIYNGRREHNWYRASSIFGHKSVEARSHPSIVNEAGWESGFKVVNTNCDCHPNVVRAGRMGRWTGGVLTHHAFESAIQALADQFGVMSPGSVS
jgi:hypothetical protein